MYSKLQQRTSYHISSRMSNCDHSIGPENYDQGAPASQVGDKYTAQRFCQATAALGQSIIQSKQYIITYCLLLRWIKRVPSDYFFHLLTSHVQAVQIALFRGCSNDHREHRLCLFPSQPEVHELRRSRASSIHMMMMLTAAQDHTVQPPISF